ncbi:MAG: ATP-dependent Clp protease proteolytic subunit [Cetobacterium sp.]
MKIIYISQLNQDVLEDFINVVNEKEGVHLMIRSGGGLVYVGDLIIEIINQNPEMFKITALECISSTAFVIVAKAKCEKKLLPGTQGMMHQAYKDYSIKTGGKVVIAKDYKTYDRFLYNQELELMKELECTEEEITKYKKGKDVHFTYERLKQLLKC